MNDPLGIPQDQLELIRKELNRFLSGRTQFKVFVFGSRRRGDFKKYSDLDLWIEADPVLSFQDLGSLHEILEDTDVPFKIDLVTTETCLDAYRSGIMAEKVLWFSSK